MSTADYRFETHWRVRGTLAEVNAILGDPLGLPRWWPEVYLRVTEPEPGVFALHTKGWLPYTLDWFFRQVESRAPLGYTIEAWGDLIGTGVWTFRQDDDFIEITYLWTVHAAKPLLRRLSFLFKPVFAANHRWAMARGYEALQREILRRRQ